MMIVRYIGQRSCQAPRYHQALETEDSLIVDSYSEGNVTFRLTCDEKAVRLRFSPAARDLLDIAVCVYIADEHVPRESGPDHWTRNLCFLLPVLQLDVWRGAEALLAETLFTLSGDKFEFAWEECMGAPRRPHHRGRVSRQFDTVCLFSGGIDSLLGAWLLLKSGRKVLLVGHQADNTTAGVQNELARRLRVKFPGQVSFIQCRAARSKSDHPRFPLPAKTEETHRVRSFLFIALAAAVAEAQGIESLFVPENGLIALNAPLQLSRLGTLSTRTAHPKFLLQLLQTLAKLGVYNGELKNPFLYSSETDMLRDCGGDVLALLKLSVSCAHPSRMHKFGKRHCGYCVPCLYRRCAMAEVVNNFEQEFVYNPFVDLGAGKLTETTAPHVRALTTFAKRVVSSTEAQRQLLVLAHGHFPANVGRLIGPKGASNYSPWSDMLLRWSQDYLRKASAWSSANTKKILSL
ncbi:MAG: hypothetical protein HY298_17385 [Verrucomicrobia bacterium]|nr:hypothetical protein [Verrucomicrobiota bacterium]